LRAWF